MNFKKKLLEFINQEIPVTEELISIPPNSKMGDFAIPCFKFAKEKNVNPAEYSKQLESLFSERISSTDFLEKVQSFGPYLNFFLNKTKFIEAIVNTIKKEKENYGNSTFGSEETVIIEYPAPNTNKPLHLGHLRNISMGSSMANIIQSQGYKTFRINLNNDRGIHICKSMLAYKK